MRPPAGSRVLQVTAALDAAFSQIDNVTTIYLTRGNRETRKDTIEVAVGRKAVSVQRQKMPGLTLAYLETMRVGCKIRTRTGSKDPTARLARITEILNQVGMALLDDPHLGGTCDSAVLGDESWDFADSTSGPDAGEQFTVLVKSYT